MIEIQVQSFHGESEPKFRPLDRTDPVSEQYFSEEAYYYERLFRRIDATKEPSVDSKAANPN